MRRAWALAIGLACFVCMAGPDGGVRLEADLSAQAQQQDTPAYQNRCAGCHGSDMTGGTGPSILTWVRYHVDKDIVDGVAKGHHGTPAQMPDAELRQMLSEMRKLAGTNPAMATGGYTGSRGAGRAPGSVSAVRTTSRTRPASAARSRRRSRWRTAASRTGILLGQSLLSAMLLENTNTKFTLLSRDGEVYREKAIAPKRDWLFYDGSLTGKSL